jgi:hypothetical protein
MNKIFCWQDELVTAESLEGRNPYILRFHKGIQIPGPVRSSCVIADSPEGDHTAEIEIWHGNVLKSDPHSIEKFCRAYQYPGAYWWRGKEGREPYQIWLYQNFPY